MTSMIDEVRLSAHPRFPNYSFIFKASTYFNLKYFMFFFLAGSARASDAGNARPLRAPKPTDGV